MRGLARVNRSPSAHAPAFPEYADGTLLEAEHIVPCITHAARHGRAHCSAGASVAKIARRARDRVITQCAIRLTDTARRREEAQIVEAEWLRDAGWWIESQTELQIAERRRAKELRIGAGAELKCQRFGEFQRRCRMSESGWCRQSTT